MTSNYEESLCNSELEVALSKYKEKRDEWNNQYELAKQIACIVFNDREIILALFDSSSKENNKKIDQFYNYDFENVHILTENYKGEKIPFVFTSIDKYNKSSLDMVGGLLEITELFDIVSDYDDINFVFINCETDNIMISEDEMKELKPMVSTFADFGIDTLEFENEMKEVFSSEELRKYICKIYDLFTERINDFCFDSKYFDDGGGFESEVFSYVFILNIVSQFIVHYNSKGILKSLEGINEDGGYHINLRGKIINILNEHIEELYKKNDVEPLMLGFRDRVLLYDNVLSGTLDIGGSWMSVENDKFGSDLYGKMILVFGDSIFYPESISDYENYHSYPFKLLPGGLDIEKEAFELRKKVNLWVFVLGDWIQALLKKI